MAHHGAVEMDNEGFMEFIEPSRLLLFACYSIYDYDSSYCVKAIIIDHLPCISLVDIARFLPYYFLPSQTKFRPSTVYIIPAKIYLGPYII